MLDHFLVLNANLITQTRDRGGDLVYSGSKTIKCWLQEHAGFVQNDKNEAQESNAIGWFGASEDVTTNSVITYDGINYRPIRIINAKRGGSSTVLFKKCYLEIARGFKGIS